MRKSGAIFNRAALTLLTAVLLNTASTVAYAAKAPPPDPKRANKYIQQFYVTSGWGLGQLSPSVDGSTDEMLYQKKKASYGQIMALGADINHMYAFEFHNIAPGTIRLSNGGRANYNMFGFSAIIYFGGHRHNFGRTGITATLRVGLGERQVVTNLAAPLKIEDSSHVLFGGGVEVATRFGLALRAEYIRLDTDSNYSHISLVYRFNTRGNREEKRVAAEAKALAEQQRIAEQIAQAQAEEQKAISEKAKVISQSKTQEKPAVKKDPDKDQDGVNNELDRCPDSEKNSLVDAKGCSVFAQLEKAINFESGSAKLTSTAQKRLKEVVAIAKQYPQITLKIAAHTDSDGSHSSNLVLSKNRAMAVKTFLVKQGINEKRFALTWFGETKPITNNKTASERAKNRRVELVGVKVQIK